MKNNSESQKNNGAEESNFDDPNRSKNTGQRQKLDPKKWPGVLYYESSAKEYDGKPDVCYYI